MSREFTLQFTLADQQDILAEILLGASIKDLAAEILETPDENPGCTLLLRFLMKVEDVATQCKQIKDVVQKIWKPDFPPVQTLSFEYNQDQVVYLNTVEIKFKHKINEDHMGDIPDFLEHVLRTLRELNRV